tara:strand:- start:260 stop:421 length:162 start_codon:yes stop_codon:yes gene_type:complete
MSRFKIPRSMHSTSEIVKLRRVIERIEKKLDNAFKILDDDEDNRTYQLNKKKY